MGRINVQTGVTSTPFTFTNLGNMASFTASPLNNKWYFHNQGVSQFQATASNIVGYADANYQTGDLIVTNLSDSNPGACAT